MSRLLMPLTQREHEAMLAEIDRLRATEARLRAALLATRNLVSEAGSAPIRHVNVLCIPSSG